MSKLFGSADLCHCLMKLGFQASKQSSSSHIKFFPPSIHKIPIGIRPFMIVQINKKQFDKHTCSRYIIELVRMGFERKEILNALEI